MTVVRDRTWNCRGEKGSSAGNCQSQATLTSQLESIYAFFVYRNLELQSLHSWRLDFLDTFDSVLSLT